MQFKSASITLSMTLQFLSPLVAAAPDLLTGGGYILGVIMLVSIILGAIVIIHGGYSVSQGHHMTAAQMSIMGGGIIAFAVPIIMYMATKFGGLEFLSGMQPHL
jgi:hypothetical protein